MIKRASSQLIFPLKTRPLCKWRDRGIHLYVGSRILHPNGHISHVQPSVHLQGVSKKTLATMPEDIRPPQGRKRGDNNPANTDIVTQLFSTVAWRWRTCSVDAPLVPKRQCYYCHCSGDIYRVKGHLDTHSCLHSVIILSLTTSFNVLTDDQRVYTDRIQIDWVQFQKSFQRRLMVHHKMKMSQFYRIPELNYWIYAYSQVSAIYDLYRRSQSHSINFGLKLPLADIII